MLHQAFNSVHNDPRPVFSTASTYGLIYPLWMVLNTWITPQLDIWTKPTLRPSGPNPNISLSPASNLFNKAARAFKSDAKVTWICSESVLRNGVDFDLLVQSQTSL